MRFCAALVHRRIDAEFQSSPAALLDSFTPTNTAPIPSAAISRCQTRSQEGSTGQRLTASSGTRLRKPGVTDRTHSACRWSPHAIRSHPLRSPIAWIDRQSSTTRIWRAQWYVRQTRSLMHITTRKRSTIAVSNFSIDRFDVHGVRRGGRASALEKLQNQDGTDVCLGGATWRQWFRIAVQTTIQKRRIRDDEGLHAAGFTTFRGYKWLTGVFLLPEKIPVHRTWSLRPAFAILIEFKAKRTSCTRPPSPCGSLIALMTRPECLADAFGTRDVSVAPDRSRSSNLLSKNRADRVNSAISVSEHALIVDRSRPMDFEVCRSKIAPWHGPAARGLGVSPLYRRLRVGDAAGRMIGFTRSAAERDNVQAPTDFGHRSTYRVPKLAVTLTESDRHRDNCRD